MLTPASDSVEDSKYETPFTFEEGTLSKTLMLNFSKHVDTSQLFFYPPTPIEVIVSTFQKMGVMRVFVTTQSGSLVGMIDRVQISKLMLGKLHNDIGESKASTRRWFDCLRGRRGITQSEQFELEPS